jgi:hypothetical protein
LREWVQRRNVTEWASISPLVQRICGT